MKKIFSFIAAMLCAASLMAQTSGRIVIPTVNHTTISVSRAGTALATGDTVTAGETLEVTYEVEAPYVLTTPSSATVTLTEEMFHIGLPELAIDFEGNGWSEVNLGSTHEGRTTGWQVNMPPYGSTGVRSVSTTITVLGETKVPFIWSINQGFLAYGEFVLTCSVNGTTKIEHDFTATPNPYGYMLYDTLSFDAEGSTTIEWKCQKTAYGDWNDNNGRLFYLDSVQLDNDGKSENTYVVAAPELKYQGTVLFDEMTHSTLRATLNGAPFIGGAVFEGDTLVYSFFTKRGYLFDDCDCDSIGNEIILAPSDFDDEGKLLIEEPYIYVKKVKINVMPIDATSVEVNWDGYGIYDSYRLLVSAEEQTGNPDYWKGVQTLTDTVYTANNLIAGQTYYVYMQPFVGDSATSWIKKSFTAGLGASCEFIIIMNDADGDGWTGNGLRVIEDGLEEFITLKEGKCDTAYYQSYGDTVTVLWEEGGWPAEVSFQIVDGNGLLLAEVKEGEAKYFSDGEILLNQVLCSSSAAPECRSRVANFTAMVDTTHFELNWESRNATNYEVAVLQKSKPTEAEIEAAAIATTDTLYSFVGNKFGIYNAFVRTECPDGQKTPWQNVLMYKDTILDDSTLFAMSAPIELDYERKGELMEYAIASDDEAISVHSFSLTDSTDVVMTFMPKNMSVYSNPGEMTLYKWDTTALEYKKIDDYYMNTMQRLDSGDYVIKTANYLSCGEFTFSVKKYAEPEPIKTDTITLDFTESGDFTNAQEWTPAGAGVTFLAHAYTFIPEDSVLIWMNVASSNTNHGVGVFVMENGKNLYSKSANSPHVRLLAKDSVYTFYVFAATMYGGSATDDYTITIKALDTIPAAVIAPIITDTTFEGVIGSEDIVFELGDQPGKVYEFVLTRQTYLTLSLDPTVATSEDADLSYLVIKDSLSNSSTTVYGGGLGGSTYGYNSFSGSEEGTHYFLFVYGDANEPYNFTLRTEPDYREVPVKDTIEVGETVKSVLDSHDGFTFHNWPGEFETFSVRLEKDKTYRVMARNLGKKSSSSTLALTVFSTDTIGKSDSYSDNKVVYSSSGSEGWNVILFTPDTTADFTIMIDGYTNNSKTDSISYEFVVLDYAEFTDFVFSGQLVLAPYTEEGIFSGNTKVEWNGTYNFNTPFSYLSYYAGVYDAVAYAVPVPAGDTLFAEFGGSHNAVLYIYDFNDADAGHYPIKADSIEYAYPYEHTYYVNETKMPRIVYVVGAMRDVLLEESTWSIRLAVGTKALEKAIVTAKANVDTVTVYNGATLADVFTALGNLTINLVDTNSNVVGAVANSLNWWCIADDGKSASYELNASDLPIGYTFAADKELVVVAINYVKRPQKVIVVSAKLSADSVTVYEDATSAEIYVALGALTINYVDAENEVLGTLTNNSTSWRIAEDGKSASYELRNSDLPKGYAFATDKEIVVVALGRIKRQQGIEEIAIDSDKAEKVLIDGQIYIIRDGKLYTIMGQLVR